MASVLFLYIAAKMLQNKGTQAGVSGRIDRVQTTAGRTKELG